MRKGINIILEIGLGDEKWLERAFEDIPVDLCLCISRYRECLPNITANEYIWYEGHGLNSIDWNTIRPLGEDVVESMRECEMIYLNMFSRAERKRDIPYQERKREYLQCLRYWNHIIEGKGIDLYVGNDIPHFGFAYIPYTLCKKKGIQTLFFQNMRLVTDALFLMEDWENPVPELPHIFTDLQKKHADGNVELPERFESYFRSQTEKTEDSTPWHMQGKKAFAGRKRPTLLAPVHSSKNIFTFVRDVLLFLPRRLTLKYWRNHLQQYVRHKRQCALFRFYDTHAAEPDLSKQYVYVALHMQPECTTAPMAGAYVYQLFIVQMLNAYIPEDVLLYVKEHPDQGKRSFDQGCRTIDFYKDLLACDRVRLVPRTFDTFSLIEHSEAVATATGSPGFEALLRKKPVLMFGYRFYQYAPGVHHIHTKQDCQEAMQKIFEKKEFPRLSDLRLFLKAISLAVIPGAVNPVDIGASASGIEENAAIVGKALAERICAKLHISLTGEQGIHDHEDTPWPAVAFGM